MKDKIIRKVYTEVKNLDRTKTYIVGLSGGADSVSLLRILHSLNFKIVAAHVHHNLRDESDDELLFCRDLCSSLGIKFESTILEFPDGVSKSEGSLRTMRYKFFENVYNSYNASGVFLGQHLDDQIENAVTSFFKRKSVLSLKAMSMFSEMNNMVLIRPLLNVRKSEILEMVDKNNIDYVTDNSNFEPIYERNKVRLQLLPLAEKIFGPGIYKTIQELINSAKNEKNTNDFYSEKLMEKFYCNNEFNLECLDEHHVNVLIYSIDKVLKNNGIAADKASFRDLRNLLVKKKTGKVNVKDCTIILSIAKNKISLLN